MINENVPFVFTDEALACVQSIQLGMDLRFVEVKIEGDALSIVRKLHREDDNK